MEKNRCIKLQKYSITTTKQISGVHQNFYSNKRSKKRKIKNDSTDRGEVIRP